MDSCSTCRFRKVRAIQCTGRCSTGLMMQVKCDGRPGICVRCEKLDIECQWRGNKPTLHLLQPYPYHLLTYTDSTHQASNVHSVNDMPRSDAITQAGHKRLRISTACQTCRRKKLKCDAGRPSCSTCLRHRCSCGYDLPSPSSGTPIDSEESSRATPHNALPGHGQYEGNGLPDGNSPSRHHSVFDIPNNSPLPLSISREQIRPPPTTETLPLPTGHLLQPYLDSYLSNVHPICFQNILHPGVLLEGLDKAPKLLLLAICGVSAKFRDGLEEAEKGRRWIAEAKNLVMKNLNDISTLTLVVLQTIALHDVHEAELLSAWNLTGRFGHCPHPPTELWMLDWLTHTSRNLYTHGASIEAESPTPRH